MRSAQISANVLGQIQKERIKITQRKISPVPTIETVYEYTSSWGDLLSGDLCKIRGLRGNFRFDAIAHHKVSGDVTHVSFYELDGHDKVVAVRAFAPERVVIPTRRTLNKQRSERSARAEKSQKKAAE